MRRLGRYAAELERSGQFQQRNWRLFRPRLTDRLNLSIRNSKGRLRAAFLLRFQN